MFKLIIIFLLLCGTCIFIKTGNSRLFSHHVEILTLVLQVVPKNIFLNSFQCFSKFTLFGNELHAVSQLTNLFFSLPVGRCAHKPTKQVTWHCQLENLLHEKIYFLWFIHSLNFFNTQATFIEIFNVKLKRDKTDFERNKRDGNVHYVLAIDFSMFFCLLGPGIYQAFPLLSDIINFPKRS